jgi:uncharacterized protein (DUF697 family)
MAWGIVTLFVVPGMVYKNLSPFDAIKDSVEALKKTWGESLVRYYGLGLIQGLLFILGIFVFLGLVFVAIPLGGVAIAVLIILGIIYSITLILLFGVADSIFNTALYVYANTGKVPNAYTSKEMSNAFRRRKK